MHEASAVKPTKFGIKVRLQLAFGAVAVMTVVAAAVAILSFSETERGFQQRLDPRSADDDRRAAPLGRLRRDFGGGRALRLGQDRRRAEGDRLADRREEPRELKARSWSALRAARAASSETFAKVESAPGRSTSTWPRWRRRSRSAPALRAKLEAQLEALHKAHTARSATSSTRSSTTAISRCSPPPTTSASRATSSCAR